MWWGCGNPSLDVAGIHFARALYCRRWASRNGWMSRCKRREKPSPSRRRWPGHWDVSGATERSWGQWCLPLLLYSRDPAQPLIDWQFQPVPPRPPSKPYHEIAGMPLPAAFIGRRRELRELGQLVSGDRPVQCLLTGAGGQGKTSLAGRLAQRLKTVVGECALMAAEKGSSWSRFSQPIAVAP